MLELAGVPTGPVDVPETVLAALADEGVANPELTAVWQNSVGGLTFAVRPERGTDEPHLFVKWNPLSSGESLAAEADRLGWLAGIHPVPQIVALAATHEDEALITHALPGVSAVDPRWQADPNTALRGLGEGLRKLHELPVDDCPFDWGVRHRMIADGIPDGAVPEAPPIDKLVVCHGDPCAPNTLLDTSGAFLAHVDTARVGAADRWADLAVMTLSFEWNYKNYDERVFWDAYGVAPDAERIAYYRALWNAGE